MGWYFVSLLETIQLIPTTHSGYAKLVEYYTTLATGLLAAQDASSGGWWLIMNEPYPGMEGNYIESSATAMFTYGFLKGIKLGLISATDYFAPAEKAYKMMLDKFLVENANGTLTWEGTVLVGSLKGEVTYAVRYPMQRLKTTCKAHGADFLSSTTPVSLFLPTTTRVLVHS